MTLNPKALALAAKLNKAHGEGAVIVASEVAKPLRFPSGSLSLDVSLGGGWSANKWAEVVGLESHGKTATILKTLAACQAVNPDFTTLWVAGEHYDEDQAAALGVDNTQVLLEPTQDLEVVYDTVLEHIADRAVDLVVIDSYPALIAPDEGTKTVADPATIAEGARLTGKFFRKMGAAGLRNPRDPHDSPWFGLFVNQWRDVIGWQPTGSPGITPGGKAKNYAFYQRVEIKRTEFIKETANGYSVGQVIKAKPFKNKGGPPRREAVIDFYFADAPKLGFKRGDYDLAKEAVVMGILFHVIRKSGGWYYIGKQKWQGVDNLIDGVRQDPDLLQFVHTVVLDAMKNPIVDLEFDADDIKKIAEEKPKKTIGRRKS